MKSSVRAWVLVVAWGGMLVSSSVQAAPLAADRVNGTYAMKQGGSSGTMDLELLSPNKVRVSLDLTFMGLVSPSTGVGGGDAPIKGNVATLAIKNEWQTGPCVISLSFEPANSVKVVQKGDGGDCGFGNHVMADGTYTKVRGGKPSRTALPTGKEPDPRALTAVVKEADVEIAAAPELVTGKRPRIDQLVAERKTLTASIPAEQRDFDQQSRTATTAIQRYKKAAAAPKPPVKPTVDELRSAAETATPTAVHAGRALVKSDIKMRALEDELVQLVAEAKQAAADAKLALAERQKATLALNAVAKKAGTVQDAQAKELAKKSEADARAKATAAATAATSAQTAAGISPTTYAARRTKADQEIQKRLKQIQDLQAELKSLKAPAAAPAAKPVAAPLKQCDLRKVDWKAWFPSTSNETDDGDEEFGVTGVEYVDLDGDGSPEALVTTMFSRLGMTAYQSSSLHVMTHDRSCAVSEAGSLDGGAMCAETSHAGNVITFNNGCDGYVAEYKLVQGSLKETKRRAQ